MKYARILSLIIILVAAYPTVAQEITPADYYYKFDQQRNELRAKYDISDEEQRGKWTEAFKPIKEEMVNYVENLENPTEMREDSLFYYAILSRLAGKYEESVNAIELYLEKYPRGLFANQLKYDLYERYTMMDGKLAEATEMLPALGEDLTSKFFKLLINMTWAQRRAEQWDDLLATDLRILAEAKRRAGHERLPAYYMGRAIPSIFNDLVDRGQKEAALALLETSIPDFENAPEIQQRLQTVHNALSIMDATAPEFKVERWVNGGPLTIENLKGSVVVIDYWATWCGPCKRVYPELNELKETFSGENLQVVGLTKYYGRYKGKSDLTKDEEARIVEEEYVPEYNITWPLGIADDQEMFKAYGVSALPTVFIIDKEGKIRERFIGHQEHHKERMMELVRELLAE